MRNTMLVMSGLIFCISSLQHFLCLFFYVPYLIWRNQCFFILSSVKVSVVWLCRWTNQVNGSWGLKSITYLKWTLDCRVVLRQIVAMLYAWKAIIPCSMMLVVVHANQLYYQAIYNFVYPSVWGWKAVDKESLVLSCCQRFCQKVLKKLPSLSAIIVVERP